MLDTLFDLSLRNWPGLILVAIPGLLNLAIFFYVITRLPQKTIPRTFAFFILSLFFWQVDDFMARLSNSAETAHMWDNLLCIGWIAMGPIGLYFAIVYTGKKNLAGNIFIQLALTLPAIFFAGTYCSDIYFKKHTDLGIWGFVNDHTGNIVDMLMVFWIAYQVTIMMVLLVQHAYKLRKHERARFQALYVAIGIGIPTAQGIVTQVIFPLFTDITSVPVTTTFMTGFSVATAIAFTKYKLFTLDEIVPSETLLESMSDIVFTVTPSGQLMYINPYGAMILGINKDEVEKHSLADLFPPQKNHYEQFLNAVMQPSIHDLHIENYNTCFINNEKQEISVLVTSDPIGDEYHIHGVLIVAHNITDMKKAEASIKEKNLELERSNAELETFAFVASHDMKEPLRMVSNYTQLLAYKYEDELDDEAKEFIHYAVEGVHRMQSLINDLLDYARIGKNDLNKQPVDCNEVVKEVLRNLNYEIEESGANIVIDKLPVIQGVETQVTQLFQNLISNAIKFRNSEKPKVSISAEKDENQWKFMVRDNGIGIDEAYCDKVFVLFQRLNERTKYPGTGIGLTVCKKIVELHGGHIWFKSAPDHGTVFYFTIPCEEE